MTYADDQLLSSRQTAALTGFQPQTLAAWRTGRGGPGPEFLKLGRSVRYRFGTIREWQASKTYSNTVAAREQHLHPTNAGGSLTSN